MIAALVALVPLALPAAQDGNRAVLFDVAIEGPVDSVDLDAGRFGSTRVHGPWIAGERATRRVPVPVPAAPASAAGEQGQGLAPEVAIVAREPGGSARLVAGPLPGGLAPDVPFGLRARPLPPTRMGSPPVRARAWQLGVVAAAFVLGLALCRRRWGTGAVLGVGAAAAFVLGVRTGREPGPVRVETVLEGEVRDGRARWLRVDVGRGELEVEPGEGVELLCAPPGRALRLSVPRDATWPWTASAEDPDTTLAARRELATAGRELRRARNDWGALADVWVRSEGGEWTHHGPWPAGVALGAAVADGPVSAAPPGWLASGLPQGVAVLLARERASGGTYLRLVGLE